MMEKRAMCVTSRERRLPKLPHFSKRTTSSSTVHRNTGNSASMNPQTTNSKTRLRSELIKSKSNGKLHGYDEKLPVEGCNEINHSANNLEAKIQIELEGDGMDTEHRINADKDDEKIFVPEIFISEAENDEKCFQRNKPKHIFVCGHVDNDMWHRLLIDLCREFSIRCISPVYYPECNRWLTKTDVFVFLMDEISVRDSPYKDQLRLAVMLNLNIVYVRDLGFELKSGEQRKPISNENLKTENKGRLLKPESLDSNNLLHPNIPVQRLIKHPLNSTIINIETGEDTASAPDISSQGALSSCDAGCRVELDINKIIETKYGTALVYHDLYHNKCLERIIASVNSIEPNPTRNQASITMSRHSLISESMSFDDSRHSLNTPTFSMCSSVSNDSALGDMFHRMTPEPNVPEAEKQLFLEHSKSLDEAILPSGMSSPTETIYLVASSSGSEKPKIFHWPDDVDKECIANSPSIDSFGFQDIDLSKRVNEINLFEENNSD